MVASAGEIAASDTVRLDALQRLGFQLVEGEVDLALPVGSPCRCRRRRRRGSGCAPLRSGDGGAGICHEPLSRALVRCRRQRPLPMPSGLKMRCAAPSIISA